MANAASGSDEAQLRSSTGKGNKGGWITFPFISGMIAGITLASSAATTNIMVYLIKEYNVKSIDAAQINNVINGSFSLAPVVAAVLADSFFGCFPLLVFSILASLLGMILFTVTATVDSMRPRHCSQGSNGCEAATWVQFAALFAAIALACVGAGGTSFNSATMGANQFDGSRDQGVFFNYYFVVLYTAAIVGNTAIVYVQDNVSWGLGFGVGAVANAAVLVVLMMGVSYYRRPRPEGSPIADLARVVVAAVLKRKMEVTSETESYYYGQDQRVSPVLPSHSLRCFNRAALKVDGDVGDDGNVRRPWHLTSVQQVEDLKAIVKILPLWSTSIFLSISIGIQISLSILQALTVDRSLTARFSVPPGSLVVFVLAAVAFMLPLLDRVVYPIIHTLFTSTPTPLRRIGVGHTLTFISMAASALVERRRLDVVRRYGLVEDSQSTVPMSVVWLIWPLVLTGAGEALHFPGQVAFYYGEFPKSLSGMATGMTALFIALGFFLSTAVIDAVRRGTAWLPDNINGGMMDKLYWMLAGIGVLNFGFFALLASRYKYKNAC